MKVLVLTALLATVASGLLNSASTDNHTQWPWQVGKLYTYDVLTYTLSRMHEGASAGSAFRGTFNVRVKAPGQLQARLSNLQRAEVHQELPDRNQRSLPEDLKFEAVKYQDTPFEIKLEGGRIEALSMHPSLSLAHENLLKGLIGTLQVDLSTHRTVHNSKNNFDWKNFQGQFIKMETDVTGDCSTLYTISPAASEWRQELPAFSLTEDPIIITKSKNYGHCHHRVGYHFGVPEAAEWTGTADKHEKEQFINRATESRILAAKQGPIYKAETTNTIYVHPYLYGKQKTEVLSYVKMTLVSFVQDNEPAWEIPQGRLVHSLLYSMTSKQVPIHDSSEESYEQEEHVVVDEVVDSEKRMRRSLKMPRKIVSINKMIINKGKDDSDREDSSSSESTSAFVNDEALDINEPAYAALYMNPQTHKASKQNPVTAQKLVQESAQLLQNINTMPKSDFLSKFNILVRVIASMDWEQLSQTSRSIEIAKGSNNVVKSDTWMVYRDAVAQAGTLPAFKQIVSWIKTKKIEGEEAAQVVASLANALRYPTKSTMMQFFELAMSPEVNQQQFLHSTALIAATKFINMGQVNNKTAHSFYPTHMYGRLARQHDNFVVEEILPRLRQALEHAIQQQDSRKAQVYIKAIGHLGHRAILEVFAPYLEGKIPVSTYLRALMVDNLEILAHERDSYTRAALFNILKNTAEPYEVRLAAIQIIFVAHPTTSMMQAMAQMTHDDPSVQVRAAITSAIETAAQQENSRHLDLARTAQAARPMLTKENFGEQYSFKRFNEYFDNEYELGIMDDLSTIGSEDSMFPKFLKYSRRSQTNGWNSISASVSSVRRLVEIYQRQMKWSSKTEANHKYSATKISEMLNIKREPKNPFEAALYIGLWNQQRYFTFSEEELNGLPYTMENLNTKLHQGIDMHYTKVFNQAQISVMFPLSSGMPFIYKYKEPTVLHVQAKAKFNEDVKNLAEFGKVQGEIQFTYARNIDASVGFMDTLTNKIASAGLVNKVQINIPLKFELDKLEMNNKLSQLRIQLQHLRPEQDTLIAHYSVWPYSTIQKKDTLVPISLDPVTKLIMRNEKVVSMNTRVGLSFSPQYQFEGYSYSSDYRNVRMFQSPNLLSDIIMAIYQRDVASTHFNLKYLGSKTENRVVSLTAAYESFKDLKLNSQVPLAATKVQDVSPNSAGRRSEMAERVAFGIKKAKAQVIDLSVNFDGRRKSEFVLTAGMADSPVDSKLQYVFFASRNTDQENNQINGVGKVRKPESVLLNAEEALQKDLKMDFEFDIKYGENESGNIHIQGQAERTKIFADALKNLPWTKLCAEQMKHNNYYQSACHRMIILAQTPDHLKASVIYKNVSPAVKYTVFQVYKMIEKYSKWNSDVDPLKTIPEGKLEIEVNNNYLESFMNFNLNSRYGRVIVKNARIPAATASAFTSYESIRPYERVANFYTRHLYQPFCTVDGDMIRTFSGHSYKYSRVSSPSWHVVMQDEPSREDWKDELVVLARRPSEKQQEVYISYESETGANLEIEIKPISGKPSVQVKTKSAKISEDHLTMYWDEKSQSPLLQFYTRPDGVLMLNIRENRLRVMYDGQRLVVLAKDGRNSTRGICGPMTGDIRDDFWTPQGLVDTFEHVAASYALKEGIDEKTQQLQLEAQQRVFQREYKYTSIMKSDSQWQKWQSAVLLEDSEDWSSQKIYRTRSHLKQPRGTCVLSKQVQYYETGSEICITTMPLEACSSHCRGEGYKVQTTQVICKSKLDEQFQEDVKSIQMGQNPEVTGVPQIKQFRVPTTCRA